MIIIFNENKCNTFENNFQRQKENQIDVIDQLQNNKANKANNYRFKNSASPSFAQEEVHFTYNKDDKFFEYDHIKEIFTELNNKFI